MDTCIVETGFLKKKPCAKPAVARCTNCESPMCAEHAVPEMSDGGKRTGKFLCPDCAAAQKDYARRMAKVEPRPAAAKPAARPVAPPPAAAPTKPEAPAEPGKKKDSGGLDFK